MDPYTRAGLLLAVVPLGTGCLASTVVAEDDRAVRTAEAEHAWRAASAADLVGLWRTRALTGAAAAAILDLSYWISADGRFSGAALFAGPPPTYQVLAGTWRFDEQGRLVLGDDAEPARAEVADGLLRLSGSEGSLTLERTELR